MTDHRVVVTGLGVISALGRNYKDFWSTLVNGQSGIAPIEQIDCSNIRFTMGAEVKNYRSDEYFEAKQSQWMDRFAQFALIATSEAVATAGLSVEMLANIDTAIITGSCLGGQTTEDQAFQRLYVDKIPRGTPYVVPNVMANAGASHIAQKYGISGPSYTISTACSSSTHAIGQAFWLIKAGRAKRAITGGSESPFSYGHLKAWEALRVVSADRCRPFCKTRNGMSLGEGGAILILESLEEAQRRGASIFAEIVGFGMSADATHLTDPNTLGQQQAIQATLRDANIQPEDIHYINAHGTGTIANDQIETTTIRAIFPKAHQHLKVSSTKSAHGHLLGATGAIETIATVLSLQQQIIPPTINYTEKDPACELPLVVNEAQAHKMNYALCSSFAFGGLNAILALRQFKE